jgi:hypothetical protein
MAKNLQRRKPGFTKSGEIKVVALNVKQLLDAREKASKKKIIAKINSRLTRLGYVAPAIVEEAVAE